ncbi:MAG TPA: hypothetical protein VGB32_01200 [Candidatus Bathyarchaeia archaeon]
MRKTTAFIILAVIMAQAIAFAYAQPMEGNPPPFRPRFNETSPEKIREFERIMETYIVGRIVISSLNIVLYGYITYFYVRLYRENESKFSLALAGLSVVLLVYALTSNPLLLHLMRGPDPLWTGVFSFIPDMLATVVAFIMIYLSKT